MKPGTWHYLLCDLTGNELTELPGATAKQCSIPVNSMGTALATLRLDDPDAEYISGGDALLKVYEEDADFLTDGNKVLRHVGRLINVDETPTETGPVARCTFADAFWYITLRLIGKSAAGFVQGTALAKVDPITIITAILAQVNADFATGLTLGVTGSSPAAAATYVKEWYYVNAAEKIAELSAPLDGPDFRVRPIEPAYTVLAGIGFDTPPFVTNIGALDVLPSISTARPDVAFEYGEDTLGNCSSYQRIVDNAGMAQAAYHLPPSFPDATAGAVVLANDLAARNRHGLLAETVVTADLTAAEYRQALVQRNVDVRADPKQTVTFTVASERSGAPRLGRDYDVGDVCRGRIKVAQRDRSTGAVTHRVRFDAAVRVYNVDVLIDENGVATQQPTVTATT